MKRFHEWLKNLPPAERCVLEEEFLIEEFAEKISEELARRKITRSELAKRLNVKKSFVTQVLKGRNVTLRTVARFAWALNRRFDLRLLPLDDEGSRAVTVQTDVYLADKQNRTWATAQGCATRPPVPPVKAMETSFAA